MGFNSYGYVSLLEGNNHPQYYHGWDFNNLHMDPNNFGEKPDMGFNSTITTVTTRIRSKQNVGERNLKAWTRWFTMTWRYRYDYFPAKMNQRFKKTKTYIDGLKSYNRMHTWEIIHISLKPNPVYIYIHILHLHIHTHMCIYINIYVIHYTYFTPYVKNILLYTYVSHVHVYVFRLISRCFPVSLFLFH